MIKITISAVISVLSSVWSSESFCLLLNEAGSLGRFYSNGIVKLTLVLSNTVVNNKSFLQLKEHFAKILWIMFSFSRTWITLTFILLVHENDFLRGNRSDNCWYDPVIKLRDFLYTCFRSDYCRFLQGFCDLLRKDMNWAPARQL